MEPDPGLTTTLYGQSFSPDGRRLYGFFETSSSQMRMHVYDVSKPPSGGQFPRRLYDALVSGGTGSDITAPASSSLRMAGPPFMVVSENRLYVWPIPSNLQ